MRGPLPALLARRSLAFGAATPGPPPAPGHGRRTSPWLPLANSRPSSRRPLGERKPRAAGSHGEIRQPLICAAAACPEMSGGTAGCEASSPRRSAPCAPLPRSRPSLLPADGSGDLGWEQGAGGCPRAVQPGRRHGQPQPRLFPGRGRRWRSETPRVLQGGHVVPPSRRGGVPVLAPCYPLPGGARAPQGAAGCLVAACPWFGMGDAGAALAAHCSLAGGARGSRGRTGHPQRSPGLALRWSRGGGQLWASPVL